MRRFFWTTAVLIVSTAPAAFALADDPILTRKNLMQSNGASMGAAMAVINGEVPFDARVAMATLQNFEAVGYSFGDYFPAGTDQGDTRASPKIWDEMAEFQQYLADFRQDATAGIEAKPETLEAFQAAIGAVGENCQRCHDEFREAE
jgi:cytochrome c556